MGKNCYFRYYIFIIIFCMILYKKTFIISIITILLILAAAYGFMLYKIADPFGLPIPAQTTQPFVTTVEKQGNKLMVKRSGADLVSIPTASYFNNASVLLETSSSVYVGGYYEAGEEGYNLFGTRYSPVFEINLATKKIKTFTRDSSSLVNLSGDAQWFVWLSFADQKHSLVLENIVSGQEVILPIENGYTQAGDVFFSPDNTKFAYAAAVGFPGKESGTVYSVDVATQKTQVIKKTSETGTFFRVLRWKNDRDIYYDLFTPYPTK